MRALSVILAITVLPFALPGVVEAATLFSPLLQAPASPGGFHCAAVNVSTQTRVINVEICNINGLCFGFDPGVSIDPGEAATNTHSSASITTRYCKVTVDGNKRTVRAAFTVFDSTGRPAVTVELE